MGQPRKVRKLDNAIAVVTGAASGIGQATAIALAEKGCDLAIADVNEVGLAETAAVIQNRRRKVSTHIVDVASRPAMEAFVDEVIDAHGHVNIVMNNAGVSVTAPLAEHSLEDFEWLMGINLWGVVYGTKLFLPHLQRASWGCVVNISSMFGLIGLPTQSSYCASKFAVRGFSEAVAAELADENIDVLCVHPGGISTKIIHNSRFYLGDRGHAKMKRYFEKKAMPASEAADLIVRAVEQRRRRLLITRETYSIDLIKRAYPPLPPHFINWLRKRSGMG